MLKLYLVRHAESMGNLRPDLVSGQSNHYPLSDLGHEQARALGAHLARIGMRFDRLFCSPAVRTVETMRHICTGLGLDFDSRVRQSERLLELHQGEWVGLPRKQVYTPEVLERIAQDNWNFKAPGGESQREVEERLLAWVNEELLTDPHLDQKVLVVSHGVAIKCLLRGILGSDPRMTHKITIDNAALTELHHCPQRGWSVETVNGVFRPGKAH